MQYSTTYKWLPNENQGRTVQCVKRTHTGTILSGLIILILTAWIYHISSVFAGSITFSFNHHFYSLWHARSITSIGMVRKRCSTLSWYYSNDSDTILILFMTSSRKWHLTRWKIFSMGLIFSSNHIVHTCRSEWNEWNEFKALVH